MCAFSERRKKNLRPHDTIKMVCNIHNGALLLCPAKLSRHKLQAGGWRSQKKVRLTRARERLKHGRRRRARASQCDPSNAASRCRARGARCARTRSHILHYSPLFPDNFCNAKVVAAATQRGGRLAGRYRARARAALAILQRRVVQNQRQPDALFGNAFKSSYVCMYSVQGVSLKNAFSATVGWLCCAEGCYFWCAHYQKMVKLVSQRTFY